MSEDETIAAFLAEWGGHPLFLIWRQTVGKFKIWNPVKKSFRVVRVGIPGMSDYGCIIGPNGRAGQLEFKGDDSHTDPEREIKQGRWLARVNALGGIGLKIEGGPGLAMARSILIPLIGPAPSVK